jgi:beta-hydroxyacyl-ACP dehydratase FabZ
MSTDSGFSIRKIMSILPHRYPILLIDRILELEPFKRVTGYKNVTGNEPFVTGHFPGNPVLPGVYMIEAMAQLSGVAVMQPGEFIRKVPYLVGIDKTKFRRPVIPGDRLMMEAVMTRMRGTMFWVHAEARVDDELACATDLMFSLVTDSRLFAQDASILHE